MIEQKGKFVKKVSREKIGENAWNVLDFFVFFLFLSWWVFLLVAGGFVNEIELLICDFQVVGFWVLFDFIEGKWVGFSGLDLEVRVFLREILDWVVFFAWRRGVGRFFCDVVFECDIPFGSEVFGNLKKKKDSGGGGDGE